MPMRVFVGFLGMSVERFEAIKLDGRFIVDGTGIVFEVRENKKGKCLAINFIKMH